jgi:hypothetical protein
MLAACGHKITIGFSCLCSPKALLCGPVTLCIFYYFFFQNTTATLGIFFTNYRTIISAGSAMVLTLQRVF